MQNNSRDTGNKGEEEARKYLVKKGYKILCSNWRFRKYEVDIIAKTEETIVFVEVKTRKDEAFGEPEVFVSRKKQKFLVAAAHEYIVQNQLDVESRFDIIAIIDGNSGPIVKHLEGAFYPTIK